MGHRRWRQSVVPGASPGTRTLKNAKPSKRATEISAALTGLLNHSKISYPWLTPEATNMPPTHAGSSSSISANPANRSLFFLLFQTLVSIMIAHRERT